MTTYFTKSCLLWVANFQGLTAGFARLPTLSRAFTVRHICITKNTEAFTRGGISIPACYYPTHVFTFHVCNHETLLDFVQLYQAHHQTPNAVLIHTMHSHPCHVISVHKCNATCHCMSILCHIYDECYMDN